MSESSDPSPKPEIPSTSEVLPYYSLKGDKKKRRGIGEIFLGFGIFFISTILFIMAMSQTSASFETGFMLWVVLVIALLLGGILMGVQFERWGIAKGLLAAILLTGALFGLLVAICARA